MNKLILKKYSCFVCLSKYKLIFLFRIVHLIITLLIQYFLMRDLEKLTGSLRIALIYFIGALAGNLASAIFVPYRAEVSILNPIIIINNLLIKNTIILVIETELFIKELLVIQNTIYKRISFPIFIRNMWSLRSFK